MDKNMKLQTFETKLNNKIKTGPIPIVNNKPNYNIWVNENKDDLFHIYNMICKYDKEINFLNECTFDIFCNFCYNKSF